MRGLDRIPRWWPVIVACIIAIAAFVRVQANDAAHAQAVQSLTERVTSNERAITDIRVSVGRIEASAIAMERSVQRIENDGR